MIHALINLKATDKWANYSTKRKKEIYSLVLGVVLEQKSKEEQKKARLLAEAKKQAEFEAKVQADIDKHGFFCMEVWSRDCDCVESTHVSKYTSLEELDQSQQDAAEWADGPMTWTYVSPLEADAEPTQRDRVMEAYENTGQGYFV